VEKAVGRGVERRDVGVDVGRRPGGGAGEAAAGGRRGATVTAVVDKVKGGANKLTITVTDKDGKQSETFPVVKKQAGTFTVGDYDVYCALKNETKIKECYVAKPPAGDAGGATVTAVVDVGDDGGGAGRAGGDAGDVDGFGRPGRVAGGRARLGDGGGAGGGVRPDSTGGPAGSTVGSRSTHRPAPVRRERDAAQASRVIVKDLRGQGFTVRDVASLIGVTPARVSKLGAA